jgi:hypothetical protein
MNSLEPTAIAVIAMFGIIIVGIDVYVRLKTAPERKDRFIRALLDQLLEPSAEPQLAAEKATADSPAPDLKECLLRHFEKSSTSREILRALSGEERLNETDLVLQLNKVLDERGKPPLPLDVARRVAMILLHAGFIVVDRDAWRITDTGRELDLLLRPRHEACLMNAA